ncbi:MAG: F0F1 ATP synthase subunit B [Bacteroidota bacterium]|nr:F0F1 ATP synthase subunit B [Bacteroidota bacterium]MDP4229404.1 F0F1 ATP synthase subunit B [Bacteroidota bacterium]MDP4237790.1 F0F1 ATP synthase subunit B [Bacteroidota bacterium]
MLEINPGLSIWTLIIFGLLLVLLSKIAWKPILASLKRREEAIADSLSKAEQARADAEKLIAETERQRRLNEEQLHKQLREGKEYAERMRAELAASAQAEAKKMLEQAKSQIERDTQTAITQLRNEAADLAIAAAGKLLDESMTDDKHRKVVEKFISELPTQSN